MFHKTHPALWTVGLMFLTSFLSIGHPQLHEHQPMNQASKLVLFTTCCCLSLIAEEQRLINSSLLFAFLQSVYSKQCKPNQYQKEKRCCSKCEAGRWLEGPHQSITLFIYTPQIFITVKLIQDEQMKACALCSPSSSGHQSV